MYMRMLLKADVAFVAKPLNYFRNHTTTVRSSAGRHGIWLEENDPAGIEIAPEAHLSPERPPRSRPGTSPGSGGGPRSGLRIRPIPWRTQLGIVRELMALDPRAASVLALRPFESVAAAAWAPGRRPIDQARPSGSGRRRIARLISAIIPVRHEGRDRLATPGGMARGFLPKTRDFRPKSLPCAPCRR